MPTKADTDVTWYLVSDSGDVLVEADDILECIDARDGVNTEARITDSDPR
jgi:hypothetical protein